MEDLKIRRKDDRNGLVHLIVDPIGFDSTKTGIKPGGPFFGRDITVKIDQETEITLNKGSLIKFLNSQMDKGGILQNQGIKKLKSAWSGWLRIQKDKDNVVEGVFQKFITATKSMNWGKKEIVK